MAGSSLAVLRSCSPSFPDNCYAQLQLLVPPEATAACLPPPPHSTRHSRPRTPVVRVMAKPLFAKCNDKDESSPCGCKRSTCAYVTRSATPLLEHCEGAFVMQKLYSFGKRKNHRRSIIVCAATNTMLDRCSNDADDVVSSTELHWQEEVFSSLQRSLLESQWALQSAQSHLCKDESSSLENSAARNSMDSIKSCIHLQQLGNSVVRSGQASARSRRLMARSRAVPMGGHASIESPKSLKFAIPTKIPVKKKRGTVKLDSAQSFISSFLKPSTGCGMLTKDQEKGFTKRMRVCQNLEKAKHELKEKVGYDPSNELWAQSVRMSTEELLAMVRKGERARNKMMRAHLRLVVSVAKAYQNLGVDMEDLILEGTKGLLRGLEKFDHRKGCKISTYVHWWIRQGITRAIADHSRLVRVPVYLHEIMFAIRGAKNSLSLQGKPATVENLSSMLNIPNDRIRRAVRAKSKVSSFDKSYNSYGLKMEFNGLHEFVADSTGENDPWCLYNEENIIGMARDRLTVLSSREQEIIRWVFGIDTEGGVRSSLTSIAIKLGVSKERVRQIKVRALSKMRPKESDGNSALLVDI